MIIRMGNSPFYEAFSYPAGERQVRLTIDGLATLKTEKRVRILCQEATPQALIDFSLLVDAISSVGDYLITTVFPYLPYSRADRRFSEGDCHGLKVFGTLVDTNNRLSRVITLDVHSSKAHEYISGLIDISPLPYIQQAIVSFAKAHATSKITVLFPDEGARKRYQIPAMVGNNTEAVDVDILHASKIRDPQSGRLSGFDVPHLEWPTLIVDDICDGGGTFVGIAAAHATPVLGLYVTHGIFSKGLSPLVKYFSQIYTTDSLPQREFISDLVVLPVLPDLLGYKVE